MSTPTSRDPIPTRALRATFIWLSHRKALGRLSTRIPITRPMVRRFIAGESLAEVLPSLERLRGEGYRTTVDVLGESVDTADACGLAAARYEETLDALAAGGLERNVSLKLSQMGLDIDRDLCRDTVATVFRKAAEVGAFVRIDMEDHTTTDRTLALWRDVRPDGWMDGGADVGLVIQSSLRRSDVDIEAIIAEGGRVRLCKGAYKEPASVAYQEKADVDAAYERQMLRLLRAGRYPALATHDVRLIQRAVTVARDEGIAKDAFEFQMLYGVRRDIQEQLVGAGWRVRTYVPFGSQWYPYFMRRLAERPANVSFILRNLWRERGRG
jgi:proline dehydrogenase